MKTAQSVLVYGNFRNLHTGHFRLLKYASELGSKLIVGISELNPTTQEAEFRFNLLSQLDFIDSVIFYSSIEDLILKVKPDIIVKGKEFEGQENSELEVIRQVGARIIFSSGDFYLSESDFTKQENANLFEITRNVTNYFSKNSNVREDNLRQYVQGFRSLKVCVVGDLIIDRYINCKAVGLSQEDSMVVYTPIRQKDYLGGAGIVAAHCATLGAETTLVTLTGSDKAAAWADSQLNECSVKNVSFVDENRPTTQKNRFRSNGNSLFRLSEYQNFPIQKEMKSELIRYLSSNIQDFDLLIFSDFSYGFVDQQLARTVISNAKKAGVIIAADSQSSSQIGSLDKFRDCDLITPTEKEARLELRNEVDGLGVIADKLRNQIGAHNLILKLGSDGILVDGIAKHDETFLAQSVPAFNSQPVDVSGAGDSLLAASAMSLAQNSTLLEAGIIGSISAAVQVSREGNKPIRNDELMQIISD